MEYKDFTTHTAPSAPERKNPLSLEQIAGIVLAATLFLLPIIILPSSLFGIGLTKNLVITIGVLISLALWLASRLRTGRIELPKHPFILSLLALPVVYLASALFSHSFGRSLIGRGVEVDTVLFVLLAVVVAVLIPMLSRTRRSLVLIMSALFAGFLVVVVFQVLRFIVGPQLLSLGVLTSTVGNLIGTWNDLGLYAGLFTVLTLVTLELPLVKWQRIVMYVSLALSIVCLILVNFSVAWIVVGVFSLLFFIYTLSFGVVYASASGNETNPLFPLRPLIVFIIALVFVIAGGVLGDAISSLFNIAQVEARPSWEATMRIAGEVFEKNPLLGSGPNTFRYEWLLNKPEGINNTAFWNTDFVMGVGTIPTSIVTVGALGLLAWLAVLALFLLLGVKTIGSWRERHDPLLAYLEIAAFLAAIYCWIAMIFYVPSMVLVLLAFVFMGIFAAVQWQKGTISSLTIVGAQGPRYAFLVTFVTIGLLVGIVAWGYSTTTRYASSVFYQSALRAADQGESLDVVEAKIQRATRLHDRDQYYRSLSQLYQLRLRDLLSQQNISEELLRSQFQEILSRTLGYAQLAINAGPKEYENWLIQGNIYASIVPLGIEGAYERAQASYSEAIALNPYNPALDLAQARLEVAHNDLDGARREIREALGKKQNYTEAVFLLSQIEAESGNIDEAIRAAQAAALISPNDPTTFFQLGLLYYSEENHAEAVPVFERAVTLLPTYANAKYFLGLSYYEEGRTEDAIVQFEDLELLNPDNQEVKEVLANLRSGNAPFAGIIPEPEDPIEREELPLEEE